LLTDRTPPHVVYVAWGFPPSRTGGVHRALATANAFAEAGWHVSVITAPREVFAQVTGTDPALEAEIDPRVTVLRVPFAWPAQDTDLRHWSPLRVLLPRVWSTLRARSDLRAFPEVGYGPWRRELEKAVLRLDQNRPVDLTVVTTNPQVSVTAAQALAGRGVPYVVDYRDAWTLHTYSGRRRHARDSAVGLAEARSFSNAAEVWFVNEPLRRWHAETYPPVAERMHVVMNGYDHDLPAPRPPDPGRPLRVGYLGTMTPVVPLQALVDGWAAAMAGAGGSPLDGAQLTLYGYLGYYAAPDPTLAAIVDGAASAGVSYAGPVSKTAVARCYRDLDVLVLLLGGGRFITSGKVFEYLSTGLPVVSVLDPDNAAADVLAGYPRRHAAADLSPAAIAAAFASAAADARRPNADTAAAAAQQFARQFRRDQQLAPRIAALRSLVEGHAGRSAVGGPAGGVGPTGNGASSLRGWRALLGGGR
jgi:glycosyltransferase involved in cell wall biosynthesis